VGITNNLERRLKEHNSGKHFYTKRYLPWEIVYFEKFISREKAREREKYYKSAAGRKKLKTILENN
jgi:putative endonuclease